MSVTETAGHLIDGFGTRSTRLCSGAKRLRSPLHLLHHSLWPREFPFGVPAGVVVDQIKRLVERGYNEVVLTGVDLTSWGCGPAGSSPSWAIWSCAS